MKAKRLRLKTIERHIGAMCEKAEKRFKFTDRNTKIRPEDISEVAMILKDLNDIRFDAEYSLGPTKYYPIFTVRKYGSTSRDTFGLYYVKNGSVNTVWFPWWFWCAIRLTTSIISVHNSHSITQNPMSRSYFRFSSEVIDGSRAEHSVRWVFQYIESIGGSPEAFVSTL